ncbi:MAG: UDP-N-acetylmuramate--L-alanine ligase [Lutibacter sp.]|uniref:UDP-N-acetylmuramate--L-alanine ligase n=1 Tax=Lutibacter sp. TaxID=1925666 RepID=UPI00299DAC7F|nr:UDP-N-acetylmuramate--L-alanine ligase [Lutibacter sp.]MDX1829335.1 UDP-N-acetylmuramate--L-alanine ligase [Lutibacter sp.]
MNLSDIHRVYFIGIGGIGMSALANYFNSTGKIVAGYDRVETAITKSLLEKNIAIHFKDSVELIPEQFRDSEKTVVVYTPAIPNNHNELNFFIKNGFKVLKRSEILGEITKNSFCLAVAGTHGKTTTSTILGHILEVNNVNATSFLGGIAENYNSNLILGGNKITVVEADEFDRSFLKLSPNIACITSMDADHLDIYKNKTALEDAFKEFSEKVSDTIFVKKGLPIPGKTFAVNETADYTASNLKVNKGCYVFDIKTPTEIVKNIQINLPGKHNVLNTVAALAMANSFGISIPAIAKALLTFKGVKRRFSYKIQTENLVLIDDYAHHPTEINAIVDSVNEMYPDKKNVGVFQPHLFSRTKDFSDEFAKSLSKFNEIILLDIYPAREKPIKGITSSWLLDKIDNKNKLLSSKENLVENIKKSKATVVVMIGAGDIGELVDVVTKKLKIEN